MLSMKATLVTGARDWSIATLVAEELERSAPDVIIVGGARGADKLAELWALDHGYTPLNCPQGNLPPLAILDIKRLVVVPAEWERYGRSAGPIRNGWMGRLLKTFRDLGWDCEVIAFHPDLEASKGTRDMCRQAVRAGFEPRVVGKS